jgi:cytochrome P450/NADPH-cytochrome P450 reductase
MDPEYPARGLQKLARELGDIYQLQLSSRVLVISSQDLVNEVCDQERFHKDIGRTLNSVRTLTGDGLFTAAHEDGQLLSRENNWWKAHRLLVPAFGPLGLHKMFDDMYDISSQLVLRWDRMGSEHAIDVSDDFTRLAFDTIGLCGFGYRFNEFYTDEIHPFAQQMGNVLKLSGRRANRTDLQNSLHYWEEQERQEDTHKMWEVCDRIIAERRANPRPDAKDVLNSMLTSTDRESGEKLSDENIRYNLATFLV